MYPLYKMTESPRKKKAKLTEEKRKLESDSPIPHKRSRTEENTEKQLILMQRKNFIRACEDVSYQAYYDHKKRFMLFNLSRCLKGNCNHQKIVAAAIQAHVEESFKIEFKTNMWCEALDICHMCITQKQYLSASVLKDVVEIMLNAHEDTYSGNSISYLLDKCKSILSLTFRKHPPCTSKSLKKCYNTFLTSAMDCKSSSFSDRTDFASNNGIVKYCWTRLAYEMSSKAPDGPQVNQTDFTPEDMKQSVKGLYWQKEKFEIFETLSRKERIDRLLMVLESVIELLQSDLAIWHSRHKSNQERHIMRSHRPLMAFILWTDNVLCTGGVNNNCRQIMKIFVDFICMGYPERHISTITLWLNTMIQMFYICETNSSKDYPNLGKYNMNFANEFYKIVKDLPYDLILKVLTNIKPAYMQHLLGILHLKTILNTKDDNILRVTIEFIKNFTWAGFPEANMKNFSEVKKVRLPKTFKKLFPYLTNVCKEAFEIHASPEELQMDYPKDILLKHCDNNINQTQVIHLLFITFEAYFEAFSVDAVQSTLESMNKSISESSDMEVDSNFNNDERDYSYSVTEYFIKKYRSTYQLIKELTLLLREMKKNNTLSDDFNIFVNMLY